MVPGVRSGFVVFGKEISVGKGSGGERGGVVEALGDIVSGLLWISVFAIGPIYRAREKWGTRRMPAEILELPSQESEEKKTA